jgi:hypothetical protein
VAARVNVPTPVTELATVNGVPAVTPVRTTVTEPVAVATAAVVALAFHAAMRPADTAAAVVVPATVKLMTVTVPSGAVYVSLLMSPVVIVPPGVNVSTSATGVALVFKSAGSKMPLTQMGAVVHGVLRQVATAESAKNTLPLASVRKSYIEKPTKFCVPSEAPGTSCCPSPVAVATPMAWPLVMVSDAANLQASCRASSGR